MRAQAPGANPPGFEFEYLNANKRSCVLALETPAGRDQFHGLLGSFDIVVAGEGPDLREALANPRAPHLIWLSVTPFGRSGPYADFAGSDLVIQAMSGWMYEGGAPEREPLRTGGGIAEYISGAFAALAAAAAWTQRQNTGRGQLVDVAGIEAVHSASGYGPLALSMRGEEMSRRIGQEYPFAIVACRDGWVGVNVLTPAHWEALCAFMQRPELVDDPRFATPRQRALAASELTPIIAAWAAEHKADDLFAANEWRLPITKLPTVAELLEFPQHLEREFFEQQTVADGRRVRRPRGPFRMEGCPTPPPRPAPALGQHTEEALAVAATADGPRAVAPRPLSRRSRVDAAGSQPLEGVRIVDLSMWWAGPFCTALLGDLGADVIKVEAVQVIDGWRGANVDAEDSLWWERSPLFAGANRNKRGLTLNLADERGRALLERILADADVLVENYTPRVMANLGLDFEALQQITPDLIMLSLPAYGSSGPWREYPGFAFPVEEMAGFPQLTGYADDGVPRRWGNAAADAIAGLNGAFAVIAALEHRRRSGDGQRIELAQVEALTCFLGAQIMDYQLSGRVPARIGNRDAQMAPHGIYESSSPGEWLAVAVGSDAQWVALCACFGERERGIDPRFATLEARLTHVDALDEMVSAWVAERGVDEATRTLQEAGVAAGPVRRSGELLNDPHFRARSFFEDAERPVIGTHTHGYRWAQFSESPLRLRRSAPTFGEHNREILVGELGLTESDLQDLVRDAVIGDTPLGGSRL
jgi:crotonobetainyl-CoA:carnitine CoA-transferase CaiB-like acyl-CoA transferase